MIPFISLFSGIGTASYALNPHGFQCIACSEIDPFARAVLRKRYPTVPNLGDITRADWGKYRGKATLVVGGSPCQSFSIAGLRTGLEGVSGLLIDYVQTLRTVRPRYFILENVPGILTCHGGQDYREFLEAVGNIGYSVAWRVLDAQFFGVAQRRRRVYVVGDLAGDSAAEILFEADNLPIDHTQSRKERALLAARSARNTQTASRFNSQYQYHGSAGTAYRVGGAEAPAMTLTSHMVKGSENGPLLSVPLSQTHYIPRLDAGNAPERTLQAHDAARPPKIAIPMVARTPRAARSLREHKWVSPDLDGNYLPPVARVGLTRDMAIRYLTPVECERLQGLPDGWTDVPYRGRQHPSDGPRYKALGNGFCANVISWIGGRMAAHIRACTRTRVNTRAGL